MAPPKLKDIVEELHGVKTKWKRIGLQLNVPDTELEKIESMHKGDPEESLYQMIREWFKTEEPTWSAIVTALRTRSVNELQLARSLKRNKCPDDHESGEPLMDVVVQKEEVSYNNTGELQMLPNHTLEQVPPQVREEIQSLAKSFNDLRKLTYHHLEELKVNPDELRVIVCNPERRWEGDDHKYVCLAKSISVIFSIISHRRYLNWQNYDLLEEIIEEYGDAKLKGELDGYCEKIEVVENKTSLRDIKNIVFTPLGTNDLLMKVPIPNQIAEPKMAVVRDVKMELKKNGLSYANPHHVGENSPLAIFFIVPPQFLLLPAMKKLKMNPEKIEDRVVYSLSEEEALELMNIRPVAIPDEAPPCITPTMGHPSTVKVHEEILHRGSQVNVVSKLFNQIFAMPCDRELTALGSRQIHYPTLHSQAPVLVGVLIVAESLKQFLFDVDIAGLHPHKRKTRPQYILMIESQQLSECMPMVISMMMREFKDLEHCRIESKCQEKVHHPMFHLQHFRAPSLPTELIIHVDESLELYYIPRLAHKRKKRPEYIESRQWSECMSMKSETSKMKRKLITNYKNKDVEHRRIKSKHQKTVKQLEADIQEKNCALQQMKHEKDALTSEHQHRVALLMQQSELLLLALNYRFQKTHLDYETAKDKAKSLEKEANEKMKIIVEEKTQLEKKKAEEIHAMAKELEIVAKRHVQEKMALETKYDAVKEDLDTATMEVEQKTKKIEDLKQHFLSVDASYAFWENT